MTDDPHDELTELESAIHYLREAQQLHDPENYNPGRQNATVDFVNDALDEIGVFIEDELERMKENSPVDYSDE